MHYVCPECKQTSDTFKNCETEGCSVNGQAMKSCNCEDGMHSDMMPSNTNAPAEESMDGMTDNNSDMSTEDMSDDSNVDNNM